MLEFPTRLCRFVRAVHALMPRSKGGIWNQSQTNPIALTALDSSRWDEHFQNKPTAFKYSVFSNLRLTADLKSGNMTRRDASLFRIQRVFEWREARGRDGKDEDSEVSFGATRIPWNFDINQKSPEKKRYREYPEPLREAESRKEVCASES